MINNDNIRCAKAFLLNIPCKEQFDMIIESINLSPLEKKIIIERFKYYKNANQISNSLFISIPLVYKKQRKALNKIYNYLVFKKAI